jgi:CDP-6-deoxy-D-xylo-4-hexulose-3-dehydrase
MIPHTLGNPCDLDAIGDIVKRHNLILVEDCCDALGTTFRGRLVGTFGDLATLMLLPGASHHDGRRGRCGGQLGTAVRRS